MGPKGEAKLVEETKVKIQELRKLEQNAPRGRYWYVTYLEAVFDYFTEIWERSEAERKIIRRVLRLHRLEKLEKVKKRSLFRRIIDASTTAPSSRRSRWTLGLKYVDEMVKEMKRNDFATFLKKNGGIVGCEVKWRALQKTKKTKKKSKEELKAKKSPAIGASASETVAKLSSSSAAKSEDGGDWCDDDDD